MDTTTYQTDVANAVDAAYEALRHAVYPANTHSPMHWTFTVEQERKVLDALKALRDANVMRLTTIRKVPL